MGRVKYSERLCGNCNKKTRMELVGEMQLTQGKIWYRCTRCHHMTLVDTKTEEIEQVQKQADISKTTLYNPQRTFNIGDSIFHSEWNDTGKVLSKIFTSDGNQAIVVSFEKQGQRTLIENLNIQE